MTPLVKRFLASSVGIEFRTITSSPWFQLTGVATECLAVSCIESITRSTSSKLRPVRHRVDQDQLDLLVRPDDEHVAHGGVVGGRAAGRAVAGAGRQHVVELGDLQLGVADHRVVGRVALGLLDVLDPAVMVVDRVDADADDLDAALVELGLDPGHVAELGGADRGEVLGVREQDRPAVADPLVEADAALRWCRPRSRGRCRRCEWSRDSPLQCAVRSSAGLSGPEARRMCSATPQPSQGPPMLLCIPDILSPTEARQVCDRVQSLKFVDGSATAGVFARTVKRNEQVENSPEAQKVQDFVMQALIRSVEFERFARPRNMKPIMFSRYEPGMEYGTHVDNAVMSRPAAGPLGRVAHPVPERARQL